MPALGALLIIFLGDYSISERLVSDVVWWKQVLIGIPLGLSCAWGAKWIIDLPSMRHTKIEANSMISSLQLSKTQMVLLSLCAGIGEELLFRGAIQALIIPYHSGLAIVLTSIFFVAIHGYLNPKAGKMVWYGAFLVGVVSIWGVLTEEIGIVVAIVAHTIVDIYLFFSVANEAQKSELPLFHEQKAE